MCVCGELSYNFVFEYKQKILHMKYFALAPMLVVITLLAFPFQSFAQDIPEDEEGEEIVIIINQDLSGNGIGRDILPVPIHATLFRLACCIEVEFLSNLGEVTIMLSNLMTGDYSITIFDSHEDTLILPLPNSSGLWQIGFRISDGSFYTGLFSVL